MTSELAAGTADVDGACVDLEALTRIYRSLYRIRRVEEEIARIYPSDKIKSPIHLSIGQEAVAVGVCEALRPDDIVFGTYRGHALYLAKGGNLRRMMAELYGKATGCAKGKGGSMHLVDVGSGVMGTSAVVATSIPNAVGFAWAIKYRKSNNVVVCFFGDGAVEEGVFCESINFASLKQLPIIFVCENNRYAIHSRLAVRQPSDNLVERVEAHGVPGARIPNNDVLEIHRQVRAAAAGIRSGSSGPVLLECMTYRWREHVGPGEDFHLGYRTRAEVEQWVRNDPVRRIAERIADRDRHAIESEVEREIEEAVEFAEQSPFPQVNELYTGVFDED